MLKAACVAFALASLGACASLGPSPEVFGSSLDVSFEKSAAPVEAAAPAAPVEVLALAAPVSYALERRRFTPPSDRQPELRAIAATATDRSRRHARRRRLTVNAPRSPPRRAAIAAALGAALLAATACVHAQAPPAEAASQQQLFLFQYSRGPAWREGVPMREQGLGPHAAYMRQLQEQGRLFAGGGYASDDGGMAIVMCADMDEARAILAADPAITSGIFVAELRHWRPRFRIDDPLPAGS
jgi:uncharacterized protein YciI